MDERARNAETSLIYTRADATNGIAPPEQSEILISVLHVVEGLPVERACRLLDDAKATLLANHVPGVSPNDPFAQLSRREKEVVSLLIQGLLNRNVGAKLFISAKTVDTHRTHIFKKLGVHHIVELVRLAALHGQLK